MRTIHRITLLFFMLLAPIWSMAQVVKGQILDPDGKPLPYASIYSEHEQSGSTTNADGFYEMKLSPGNQNLTYQFLGYSTTVETVKVPKNGSIRLDVVLRPVAYNLGEAVVNKGEEDPAYPIMRKAIAKAKYHTQQLESYSARVYMKGSGGLRDIPFLFRNRMKKQGIDTSFSFVSETITEIHYQRPGKYTEDVISVRSNGNSNDSSPVRYINGSFYEPKIAGLVSPLSPKAFAYYRFKYLNTFEERGYQVDRIKVTPRSPGEDVVSGEIYLVEGLWSIHSLDFNATLRGIDLNITKTYAPIKQNVWLPVSHLYKGTGKLFGFEFDFTYVATVSDYQVTLNRELPKNIEVVDNKTQEKKATQADNALEQFSSTQKKLSESNALSQKKLKKLMKKYEKQARKENGERDVVREINVNTDSTAYNADSTFWAKKRPIPLTQREERGYHRLDSIAVAEKKKASGDTLGGSGFKVSDILLGGSYKLGENDGLQIHNPVSTISFNTVDGFHLDYPVSYYHRFNKFSRLEVRPQARYAHARRYWSGKLMLNLKYGNHPRQNSLTVVGGRYYRQINIKKPIAPLINGFYSLFLERNYLKLYDRDFAGVQWKQHLTDQLTFKMGAVKSQRKLPPNYTDLTIIDDDTRAYTPNDPQPFSQAYFPNHSATWGKASLSWRPFEKYFIRNDRKRVYSGGYPVIEAQIRQGFPKVLNSDLDFTALTGAVAHRFDFNKWGNLGVTLRGGTFLNDNQVYFPDYAHFMGNQTAFSPRKQMQQFYSLPYYTFSTTGDYYSGMINYTFRRFLLTRIRALQLSGLNEHLNFNYLHTADVEHAEIGFSITHILQLFRLDFVTTYRDWNFHTFLVTFGISSDIISFGE